jgi:hypothetical protein
MTYEKFLVEIQETATQIAYDYSRSASRRPLPYLKKTVLKNESKARIAKFVKTAIYKDLFKRMKIFKKSHMENVAVTLQAENKKLFNSTLITLPEATQEKYAGYKLKDVVGGSKSNKDGGVLVFPKFEQSIYKSFDNYEKGSPLAEDKGTNYRPIFGVVLAFLVAILFIVCLLIILR